MEEKYLLELVERYLKYYKENLNNIKKELGKIGPYGAGNSFYPVSNRKEILWILDSLKKTGYDTLQFERELSIIDKEFESYKKNNKEEYINHLYNDLKRLIDEYYMYYMDFQKEKAYFRTKEGVDPLYKEYFLNREEGLFFADGYEFDSIISIRTYIEILFEYLCEKFDIVGLRDKVKKVDSIFKRDVNDILKSLKIDKSVLLKVSYAPKEYWWLHL